MRERPAQTSLFIGSQNRIGPGKELLVDRRERQMTGDDRILDVPIRFLATTFLRHPSIVEPLPLVERHHDVGRVIWRVWRQSHEQVAKLVMRPRGKLEISNRPGWSLPIG
jgi:hypothetical protein